MHPEEVNQLPGKLVVFEGIDGSGKSSILSMLPNLLSCCQVPIIVSGERRSPLAPFLSGEMLRTYSPFLKTYLFAADRAWAYDRECLPALRSGGLVLWDRYVDSAIVYRSVEFQLRRSGLDLEFVRNLNSPFIRPSITFFIDITVEVSLLRTANAKRTELYDAGFLRQVRLEYLALAAERGYIIISGERPILSVAQEVTSVIKDRFKEMF